MVKVTRKVTSHYLLRDTPESISLRKLCHVQKFSPAIKSYDQKKSVMGNNNDSGSFKTVSNIIFIEV